MTTFYFRRSVEKAFQLDEQPSGLSLNMSKPIASNAPHISSAVDDVMYIVNQILQRALATSQRPIIASVIPTLGRVLGSDFVGMVQRKMRDESYPKPSISGGLPPEHVILAFLVLLNNLDIATDYVKRIVSSKLTPITSAETSDAPARTLRDTFPFENDAIFTTTLLKSLESGFESKTSELMSDGIFLIFKNVFKPRLRPILADAFRDIEYSLSTSELEELSQVVGDSPSEEEGTNAIAIANSSPEIVSRHFRAGWEALTRPINRICTGSNFDKLLVTALNYLAELLEKRIWGYYGRINNVGAGRLERDVAEIISVAVKGARYALRDAFARCSQICLVMNMEEDEWEEVKGLKGEDSMDWKIDAGDRERARGLVKG